MALRADLIRKTVGFVASFLICGTPSFACQNECVIIETSKKIAMFRDLDGKAIRKAEVVIRDATTGTDCRCGKFGRVVKQLRTDEAGHFNLKGLRPGDYWVTYMDQQDGESFYIRFEHGKNSSGPLELEIDHFGEQCYLVDVERNTTKPATAPKPRAN